MKASKTATTIAAAALVSMIGLAYAQTSDMVADPSVNPQNRRVTLGDQQSTDTFAPPVDTSVYTVAEPQPVAELPAGTDNNLNANGATSSAADPNAANTTLVAEPTAAMSPSETAATPAAPMDTTTATQPNYSSDSAPIVERAPRPDRN